MRPSQGREHPNRPTAPRSRLGEVGTKAKQAALDYSSERQGSCCQGQAHEQTTRPRILPRPDECHLHHPEASLHPTPSVGVLPRLPQGLPSASKAPPNLPLWSSRLPPSSKPSLNLTQHLHHDPLPRPAPSPSPPAPSLWSSILGEGPEMRSKGEGQAPPTERPCQRGRGPGQERAQDGGGGGEQGGAWDGVCFQLGM